MCVIVCVGCFVPPCKLSRAMASIWKRRTAACSLCVSR